MSVLKYTRKYLLYSLVPLLVICGVWALVYSQIQKDHSQDHSHDHHDTFGFAGAEVSDASKSSGKNLWQKITPKINKKQPKTRHDHKHFGHILSDHTHPNAPPRLPANIQARIDEIYQEMLLTRTFFEIQNGEKVVTEAAYKRLYDALVGEMSLEDAVVFLETYHIYNPIILDKLEPHRAIDYLYKVRARWTEKASYARNVLIRDPGNIDARLVLLSAEPDDSAAVAGYRDIVTRDPGNINALIGLGYRLHYNYPEEALQYLKRVNILDGTRGLFSLGLAHERLGDLKAAWLYYSKQQTIQNGGLVDLHKRSIERGTPLYDPVSLPSAEQPVLDETSIEIAGDPHEAASVPVSEESPPWLPEDQLTKAERRESDRAEAEKLRAAEQQEFDTFLKWAENTMNAEESLDFLSIELAAHLKGESPAMFSPERLIRAYELIEKSGFEEGIHLIRAKDPELAKQIERFTEKRQNKDRNNSQRK